MTSMPTTSRRSFIESAARQGSRHRPYLGRHLTIPERRTIRKTIRRKLQDSGSTTGSCAAAAVAGSPNCLSREGRRSGLERLLAVQRKLEHCAASPKSIQSEQPATAKGMYSKATASGMSSSRTAPGQAFRKIYQARPRQFGSRGGGRSDGVPNLTSAEAPRLPDLFVPIEHAFRRRRVAATPTPVAPEILPATARDIDVIPCPDTRQLHRPHQEADRLRRKRSIYLQYAYITYSDEGHRQGFHRDARTVANLSNSPNMDVRIIVGSAGAADKIRMLVEAGFKETVFRTQGNIHNKGIVVDGETCWSAARTGPATASCVTVTPG